MAANAREVVDQGQPVLHPHPQVIHGVRVEAHSAVALGAKLAQLCLEALRVKPVPACSETNHPHQHMCPKLVPAACIQHSSTSCVEHGATSDAVLVPAVPGTGVVCSLYQQFCNLPRKCVSLELSMCAHWLHTSWEAPGLQD
jgi:hypothetical protein